MSLSSALPTGTVTFLFTDIEGSTQLWERQPDAMRSALARHDQILRDVVGRQGGGVFKTVGDSFCAAFATATDALEAALTAQKALGAEERAGGLRLRVRMALHTGAVEERDGDYFGQALNRVSRLLSAAHGGQTLVSAATHQLVRDALPPGVTLGHLGEHRLRDLSRPEQVFQLCHPELPHEFPPLRGMNHPGLPNNLPQQLTSFIGRERELAAVKGLLGSHRLVTLAGSGGCGKTRLALQAAADVLEGYPNGAWLVELGSLLEPALVAQAVVSALGLREQAGQTPTQTLAECLKPKTMLLILDNCEHLLAACADLADGLLRACPQVTLLASSREALGIAGEQTYRVPSLSVPDPRQLATVESLSGCESVRLFLDRATLSRPDFRLTAPNAPALASVCQRLDGIPLAIELAAARVRSLSVEEIAGKLDSRFRLLTGGSRMALPRQQTLRALIDWSYSLLNAQEKRLLNRLSVFAGGWTLEAAEQVCVGAGRTEDGIEDWETLDLLVSLVDKSVALAETQGEGNALPPAGDGAPVRAGAAARERRSGRGAGAAPGLVSWLCRSAPRPRRTSALRAVVSELRPLARRAGQPPRGVGLVPRGGKTGGGRAGRDRGRLPPGGDAVRDVGEPGTLPGRPRLPCPHAVPAGDGGGDQSAPLCLLLRGAAGPGCRGIRGRACPPGGSPGDRADAVRQARHGGGAARPGVYRYRAGGP